MKIVLGSTSRLKTAAVEAACRRLNLSADISGIAADSGVPAQPLGEETAIGARNRALAAASVPGTYAIGIENGIRGTLHGFEDWAVVVLIAPDGTETRDESAAVIVPDATMREVLARGRRTVTCGQVLAERWGAAADDPHTFLTGGMHSRLVLLIDPLIRLLTPLVSTDGK